MAEVSNLMAIVRRSPPYGVYRSLEERWTEARWRRAGRPAPAPPQVKRRTLVEAARRHGLRTFVETGTYHGDTVAALVGHFDELHSVELFEPLYEAALARFHGEPRVHLHQGNSGELLPRILRSLDGPALLWLDAHYSGPGTGACGADPPRDELAAVFAAPHPHVIYIDDAQTFVGTREYPAVDELEGMVREHRPGWTCRVLDDIIRIEPAPAAGWPSRPS